MENLTEALDNLDQAVEETNLKPTPGDTTEVDTTKKSTSRKPFRDRAELMGLTTESEGIYTYSDKYGNVKYKELNTVDGDKIPLLAVFTGGTKGDSKYTNIVSDNYQFMGNESIINKIIECISEVGEPVVLESPIFSPNYTQMHNEIVISNKTQVHQVGDIYPQLIISNSYNGSKAANVAFGISINDLASGSRYGIGFRSKLGTIRQVHLNTSFTILKNQIGNYVEAFKGGINTLIETNFNRKIKEDDIFNTLELVEKVSKKRRDTISVFLNELIEKGHNSFWDLFHTLVKFSAAEKNINSKLLLENIAEGVIVLPPLMHNLIKK